MLYCADLLCLKIGKSTVYLLFQSARLSYPGHFQISDVDDRNTRTNFSKECQWMTLVTNFMHGANLFLRCCYTLCWPKIFSPFKRSEVSLLCPWETATGLLPETDNQIYTLTAPHPCLHLGLHSVFHLVISEMNCAGGRLFSPRPRKQSSYATVGFSTSHISMECRQQWKQPVTEGTFCFQQFLIMTPTRKPIHFTDCC
jgi:hypothetical protein